MSRLTLEQEKQLHLFETLIKGVALLFMASGALLLYDISFTQIFWDTDPFTGQIVASFLIAIGLADFVLAKPVIQKFLRKNMEVKNAVIEKEDF